MWRQDLEMIERPDKVRKIRKDYESARRKGKDHFEAIIYCVEQNLGCTSQEFFKAIYRVDSLFTWVRPESAEKQKKLFAKLLYYGGKEIWRIDKHRIAVDDQRFKDYRIISVPWELKQLDGSIIAFKTQGFAEGDNALRAIPKRKKVIKGIEREMADYYNKGHDTNLKRRLAEAKRKRAKEIGGKS